MAARTPKAEAPEAPTPTIAALAAAVTTPKAVRVFADVPGIKRVICEDGTVAAIQHEVRADESNGPWMLALLTGGTGQARRYELAPQVAAAKAFADSGQPLF